MYVRVVAENCFTYTVYIHKRNPDANLIEINEGMSELLDNQVNTQNGNMKKIRGLCKPL